MDASLPMDAAVQAFNKKLDRKSKSQRTHIVSPKTKGELRHKITLARQQLNDVVNVFRCVLHRMCILTHHDYTLRGDWPAWEHRWKPVSAKGCDVIRGRIVDYGNVEYATILQFLYLQDSNCKQAIDYLVIYWASIHPTDPHHYTEHGVSMQGDVIEICLAALRGHPDFDMTAELARQKCSLPTLFLQVCQLCQLVQYIDAAVRTGWIKASGTVVTLLRADVEFHDDAFISAWKVAANRRGYCLHALLNV